MKRVTIQGEPGCFHEAAARQYFKNEEIETIPCETFTSMFDTLNNDASLIGTLAIENTIAGSLLQNHELLRKSNLAIVGEYKMHISHVLAALPGQSIEDLNEVNSHPMALMQCAQFLHQHPNMKIVEKNDTAGSAQEIAQKKLNGVADVCGEYAAKLYQTQFNPFFDYCRPARSPISGGARQNQQGIAGFHLAAHTRQPVKNTHYLLVLRHQPVENTIAAYHRARMGIQVLHQSHI